MTSEEDKSENKSDESFPEDVVRSEDSSIHEYESIRRGHSSESEEEQVEERSEISQDDQYKEFKRSSLPKQESKSLLEDSSNTRFSEKLKKILQFSTENTDENNLSHTERISLINYEYLRQEISKHCENLGHKIKDLFLISRNLRKDEVLELIGDHWNKIDSSLAKYVKQGYFSATNEEEIDGNTESLNMRSMGNVDQSRVDLEKSQKEIKPSNKMINPPYMSGYNSVFHEGQFLDTSKKNTWIQDNSIRNMLESKEISS